MCINTQISTLKMVIAFVIYIFRRYVTFCILNAHLHQRKIFEKRSLGVGVLRNL